MYRLKLAFDNEQVHLTRHGPDVKHECSAEKRNIAKASCTDKQCRAALVLACYYPAQWIETDGKLVTTLDQRPTYFVAKAHIDKVYSQHPDMTRWQLALPKDV
jgi:hypothetical protein